MPSDSKRSVQQTIKQRKFINKDFDAFRGDLEEYARTFFPNKLQDFSSNGFGGLLIELASYVGDVQSFYLDHQFGELNAETAVESKNIEKLLREAGVDIVGSAPATVPVTFYVSVPVAAGTYDRSCLPVVKAETTVNSSAGVTFELIDDIDFSAMKSDGSPAAGISYTIGSVDTNNNPTDFVFSAVGVCISSATSTESFTVNGFEAFKRVTLQNRDVTEIVAVYDSSGNDYYEVGFLTQDTVFRSVKNQLPSTSTPVGDIYIDANLEITPAPFRFYKTTSLSSRLTSLTFGGGSSADLNANLVPDPSEAALPLYGKTNFSRFAIDPNNLLRTGTLGAISPNSTITVVYRSGGGSNHNIAPQSISEIATLVMEFPNNPPARLASSVRASTDANNNTAAVGGADPPTLDELRIQIPSARNAQSRIVSKEDLLARIFSMPANFGRVFRASIRNNPDNPNSAMLYLLCKNTQNQLVLAPDILKKNLAVYLNQYRMISDAIDILDGRIINLQIAYDITADPTFNRQLVLQNVQGKLLSYFNTSNFQMDQPIVIDDVRNIIYNNIGVISVRGISITNVSGVVASRQYSSVRYDVNTNLLNNSILVPPPGGMFEIRFPNSDITGRVI